MTTGERRAVLINSRWSSEKRTDSSPHIGKNELKVSCKWEKGQRSHCKRHFALGTWEHSLYPAGRSVMKFCLLCSEKFLMKTWCLQRENRLKSKLLYFCNGQQPRDCDFSADLEEDLLSIDTYKVSEIKRVFRGQSCQKLAGSAVNEKCFNLLLQESEA